MVASGGVALSDRIGDLVLLVHSTLHEYYMSLCMMRNSGV